MQQHGRTEFRDDVQIWAAALKAAGCRPRPEGAGFRASCPGPRHKNGNRNNPALSIRQGDGGRVLVTCFAGCTFEDIRHSLGMDGAPPAGSVGLVESWNYVDMGGELTLTVHRRDRSGGGKEIWRSPKGAKPPAEGWPLYQLPSLIAEPGRPILVVEGERTCDHAQHLFGDRFVVTTALGGAGKARQNDWSPCRGRVVNIWPDNDETGFKHARDVDMLARDAGAKEVLTVREEDLADFRKGWDLADKPPPGADIEGVLANSFSIPVLYTPGTVSRNAFTPLGELLGEPIPDVDWIVEGLLPAGGTALLVGPPKSGKSTLGRNLVAAVGEGRDILGRPTRKGAAIYATFEGRRAGVAAHFRDMDIDLEAAITVYVGEAFAPDAALEIVEAEIEKTGATLIVIDTLLRFMRVGDANAYAEISNATQTIIDLASRTGCTVVGIHHSRKGGGQHGEEASGSAALLGSVDVMASITREGDEARMIYSIQREGSDLERTSLTLGPTGWLSLGSTAREEREAMALEAVTFALSQGGVLDSKELVNATKLRKAHLMDALAALIGIGKIVRSGAGKRGNPFKYQAV